MYLKQSLFGLKVSSVVPAFRMMGETFAPKMAYILSDVSDRTIRACNMSGATQAAAHDISKAFDMIWHTGLIHRLDSYRMFVLMLSDDGFCIICYLW